MHIYAHTAWQIVQGNDDDDKHFLFSLTFFFTASNEYQLLFL